MSSRPDFKCHAGFTLVEILVVVLIVGIMAGLVSINLMQDDQRTLTTESQKLSLLLEQAHDEAIISGKEIAWSAKGETYHFWQKNDLAQWAEYKDDELFRERAFAQGVQLAEMQINQTKSGVNERLVFSPSGLNTPFSINLALNNRHMLISGDSMGKISLKNHE